MDTFIEIGIYSVGVLLALTLLGVAMVFVGNWLVDNTSEPNGH